MAKSQNFVNNVSDNVMQMEDYRSNYPFFENGRKNREIIVNLYNSLETLNWLIYKVNKMVRTARAIEEFEIKRDIILLYSLR